MCVCVEQVVSSEQLQRAFNCAHSRTGVLFGLKHPLSPPLKLPTASTCAGAHFYWVFFPYLLSESRVKSVCGNLSCKNIYCTVLFIIDIQLDHCRTEPVLPFRICIRIRIRKFWQADPDPGNLLCGHESGSGSSLKWLLSREKRLSRVIQAIVGRLELWDGWRPKCLYHQEGNLWPNNGPLLEEGQLRRSDRLSGGKEGKLHRMHLQQPEFEPQPEISNTVRPSSVYCTFIKAVKVLKTQ